MGCFPLVYVPGVTNTKTKQTTYIYIMIVILYVHLKFNIGEILQSPVYSVHSCIMPCSPEKMSEKHSFGV